MKRFFSYVALVTVATIANSFANLNFIKDRTIENFNRDHFSSKISKAIFEDTEWPSEIEIESKKYKIFYNFDEGLTNFIKKRLQMYRSDYASVVVINNNNGKVLSAVDYTYESKKFDKALAFSSTNPAASIFKVVTAADLLEKTEVTKESSFNYNGRSSTLYKYQLKDKTNKWTRTVDLGRAFASSNNVVFGKAAVNNLSDESLYEMAVKFGFQQNLLQMVDTDKSKLFGVNNSYGLAELASGFNKQTLISPLHGAVIASIVVNDGMLRKPAIISSVVDQELNKIVWEPQFLLQRSISKETAADLREMMMLTVKKGTARSAFRPWKIKKIQDIEIGGKTGSITGGEPYGKRDWFISYAKPAEVESDKGISLAVMVVNVKKWHVKSTHLAKEVIQYYYENQK